MAALKKQDNVDSAIIRDEIIRVGNEVRARWPLLDRYQDYVGLAILVTAVSVALAGGYAIHTSAVPYWVGFLVVAFATSIVHEMEHDLIHNMYFANGFMNDVMMAMCWSVRWNGINPWTRRRVHFHHHKASGTASDIEEQAITNGTPFGLRRLLMMADNGLAFFMRPLEIISIMRKYRLQQEPLTKPERVAIALENIFSYFPLGVIHIACMYSFIAYHVISRAWGVEHVPRLIVEWMPLISQYLWCQGFPNAFRVFILITVSSNMHYFGDIDRATSCTRRRCGTLGGRCRSTSSRSTSARRTASTTSSPATASTCGR